MFSARTGRLFTADAGIYASLQAGAFFELPAKLLRDLTDAAIIVPSNEDEFDAVVRENSLVTNATSDLYFVVQPTAACQLGCGYCGQVHTKRSLSETDQEHIVTLFSEAIRSSRYTSAEIAWFGGEPLIQLPVIRRLSSRFCAIADSAGITYRAKVVTNGLLLTDTVTNLLVDECRVTHIEITLDGPENVHNESRAFKTGRPSFDRIVRNLVRAVNLNRDNVRFVVRCNVTRENGHRVFELIDCLYEYELARKITFYPAPVHDWGNDADQLGIDKDEYAELDTAIHAYLIAKGFEVSLLPQRRETVCLAVRSDSFVFDAYGSVHKCTETPYVPKYDNEMGYAVANLASQDSMVELKTRRTALSDALDHPESISKSCQKCTIFPICGGACPKQWLDGKVPCPPVKHNIRDKMALALLSSTG
jgi:uncharacterized protein